MGGIKFMAAALCALPLQVSAAYYAELDKDATVLRVVVIEDFAEKDADGKISEAAGAAWCQKLWGGTWVKTSTDGARKHYAGIGYKYAASLDAFIPPKPYPSWVLDKDKAVWIPPVMPPADDGLYAWSEDARNWTKVEGKFEH